MKSNNDPDHPNEIPPKQDPFKNPPEKGKKIPGTQPGEDNPINPQEDLN